MLQHLHAKLRLLHQLKPFSKTIHIAALLQQLHQLQFKVNSLNSNIIAVKTIWIQLCILLQHLLQLWYSPATDLHQQKQQAMYL
jgi:hypothetical protein